MDNLDCHCLCCSDVEELLRCLVEGLKLGGSVGEVMDRAASWETKAVCLSFFIARYLASNGCEKISLVYGLEESHNFEIEESDESFVDYMLRHQRDSSESLEDALIALQDGIGRKCYEKALRY
jgi:hypothetical protein